MLRPYEPCISAAEKPHADKTEHGTSEKPNAKAWSWVEFWKDFRYYGQVDEQKSSGVPGSSGNPTSGSAKIAVVFGLGVRYWRERIKRRGCVLLAHQNLKPRAGPCNVLAHSSYRVSLHRRLNAGILERTFSQLRLNTVTERFDENQIRVLHGSIISPDGSRGLTPG